jgi:hypothetical protein
MSRVQSRAKIESRLLPYGDTLAGFHFRSQMIVITPLPGHLVLKHKDGTMDLHPLIQKQLETSQMQEFLHQSLGSLKQIVIPFDPNASVQPPIESKEPTKKLNEYEKWRLLPAVVRNLLPPPKPQKTDFYNGKLYSGCPDINDFFSS